MLCGGGEKGKDFDRKDFKACRKGTSFLKKTEIMNFSMMSSSQVLKGEECNFENAVLIRPNFDGCTLENPSFKNAILVDPTFKGATIIGGNFEVRFLREFPYLYQFD